MKEPTATRVHRFHPIDLDPVTVYVEEYAPGASRVTIRCYAQAWTAYWGSHGAQQTVEQFMCDCDAPYVVDNLLWGMGGQLLKTAEKRQRDYLSRIVHAIQKHFRATQPEPLLIQ